MKRILAALLCSAALVFASLSIGQDIDSATCQQTLKANCTSCHSIKRICHELDEKDANWPAIIKEMGELGNLSQKIQDTALNCLTKTDTPKAFVCQ